MSVIKVNCIDQVLTVVNTPVIASGGREENTVAFNFCSAWDGFSRIAVFWRDPAVPYSAVLNDEDTGVVPWEVLEDEGVFSFGVYGLNADGVRRTSLILRYRVEKGAFVEGAEPSDPTQELWEQLLARCSEAIAKCSEAVDATANKADRPESATAGNLAALTAAGDLADSGKSLNDLQQQTAALTESTAITDADTVPFYDASASAHRRTKWSTIVSKIKTAIWGTTSGFVKADGSGGISGVDVVPVESGGTGATTVEGVRANLGLGAAALLDTIPVKSGGTGATTAAAARSNLGLGAAALLDTIPVESGGTGATTRKNAAHNLLFLGEDPVTADTDTAAAWAALGTGYADITKAGVVKDQPSAYGFIKNYVYGSIVVQIWQSIGSAAVLGHRSGNASGWFSSWVINWNSENLTPAGIGAAELDAYGKVKPGQISSRRINIDSNTTLSNEHAGASIVTANDSAITLTLPDDSNNDIFPLNTEIEIVRFYGGGVTIKAPSGVYLFAIGASSTASGQSYTIPNRYGVVVLKKLYAARWIISGDLA